MSGDRYAEHQVRRRPFVEDATLPAFTPSLQSPAPADPFRSVRAPWPGRDASHRSRRDRASGRSAARLMLTPAQTSPRTAPPTPTHRTTQPPHQPPSSTPQDQPHHHSTTTRQPPTRTTPPLPQRAHTIAHAPPSSGTNAATDATAHSNDGHPSNASHPSHPPRDADTSPAPNHPHAAAAHRSWHAPYAAAACMAARTAPSGTAVYSAVVSGFACPSNSCTARRSRDDRYATVPQRCLSVCVVRLPGSAALTSFPR